MRNNLGFTVLTPLLILTMAVFSARAQNVPVPVPVQYRLILKILDLDRRILRVEDGEVVLGIIYQKNNRVSLENEEELMMLIQKAEKEINSTFQVRAIAIDFVETTDLKSVIQQNKIQILYVAPLRSISVERITSISRELKMSTFTGVPEYAEKGIGITIDIKGEKPMIVVNLPATKAEGSNYSSQLLGLARVIE